MHHKLAKFLNLQ
jgi:hypothetical protein